MRDLVCDVIQLLFMKLRYG